MAERRAAADALVGLGGRRSTRRRCRAHALGFLRETVGIGARPRPPVALGRVRIEPARHLRERALEALRAHRRRRGRARGPRRTRAARRPARAIPTSCACAPANPRAPPTRSCYPGTHEQLRALLELCAGDSLAVVPFGGGTSVVGGVAPLRGEHAGVLALDMGRWARLLGLDRESLDRDRAGGHARARARARAAARGLTLGHFPQSFEYVSLGGCAATRSAGQASTGYGAIEKMVLGLRLVAPAGGDRGCRRCRRARQGPGCASCWSARRARSA